MPLYLPTTWAARHDQTDTSIAEKRARQSLLPSVSKQCLLIQFVFKIFFFTMRAVSTVRTDPTGGNLSPDGQFINKQKICDCNALILA